LNKTHSTSTHAPRNPPRIPEWPSQIALDVVLVEPHLVAAGVVDLTAAG
jgi:hypothetical protein